MKNISIAKTEPLANGKGFFISGGPNKVGGITFYNLGHLESNDIKKTSKFIRSDQK